MKKIFFLLVLCLLCSGLYAETQGDFDFDRVGPSGAEQRAVITGYSGGKFLSVPARLGGARVNRIAANAFRGKGITHIDINFDDVTIDEGAFADNPIEEIVLGNNLSLASRSFDRNFVSYYTATRKKVGGEFKYNEADSKWMTKDDWILAQAKKPEPPPPPAPKPAPPPPPPPAPKPAPPPPPPPRPDPYPDYTYSYSDFDIDFAFLFGGIITAGYLDFFSGGLNFQTGLIMGSDDVRIALLGQVEGAITILFLPSWGYGVIGELHFGDAFGLGFGTGFANSLWYALDAGSSSDSDSYETETDFSGKQYLRGALILFDDDVFEAQKITIYADYFLNGNWRVGLAFHYGLDDW